MARRLQARGSDDEDTPPTQNGKPAAKSEKRRTRARVTVQDEEEDDPGQQPVDEDGGERDNEQVLSRGSKRRRINGDGESVPSRAVSQEAEGEDEQNIGSQIPKVEIKTQPRDTDGSAKPLYNP
jgi:hypothetical protein